ILVCSIAMVGLAAVVAIASGPGAGSDASAATAVAPVAATVAAVAPAAATPRRSATRWGADYFPNVELTTHEGKKVRFFDDLIKDKVVAINFIFTKCRNTCPSETAKMRQVQRLLGDRVGKDVFMYSISIDPRHDTPERLNEYTKKFGVQPGWLFLTGDNEDIVLIQRKLGMFFEELKDDPEDHNTSLIVGNQATGRWQKRSPHDDPNVLAGLLGEALHNYKSGTRTVQRARYDEARVVPAFSRGQYLFRTRCSTCHTIGGGDDEIGPDLLGVTDARERDWLLRWIKAPDEMLAEKDPIAMGLFYKFNELQMPNLKLGDLEANALIEYMATESRRVEKGRLAETGRTAEHARAVAN
ncbi:MAG: SCO family protein, partial [Candidatus Binatia bacterium]